MLEVVLSKLLKKMNRTYTFIFIFLICLLIGCEKFYFKKVSFVETNSIVVLNDSIEMKGNIIDLGEGNISDHGFWYHNDSTNINLGVNISLGIAEKTGDFESTIYGINPDETYYVRAFINDNGELKYGKALSISLSSSLIKLNTGSIIYLSNSSVLITGWIEGLEPMKFEEHGFSYSTNTTPTVNDNVTKLGNLAISDTIRDTIENLNIEQIYYMRLFGQDANNIEYYGNQINFKIPDLIIITNNYTITYDVDTTVNLRGHVKQIGVKDIKEQGFCYSYSTNIPTINENLITTVPLKEPGFYYGVITSPETGITYYYRAYATDGSTVRYGNVITFSVN